MRIGRERGVDLDGGVLVRRRCAALLQLPAAGDAASLRAMGRALARESAPERTRHLERRVRGSDQRAPLAAPRTIAGAPRLRQSGVLARSGGCAYANRPAARRRRCARLGCAGHQLGHRLRWSAGLQFHRACGRGRGPAAARSMERSYPSIDPGRQDLELGARFMDVAETASYAESTLGERALRAHA
jgi:hypothetical protein